NRALAECGKPFIVPAYFSEQQWHDASVHQRGTAVEAAIGRLFLKSSSAPGGDSVARHDLVRISTGVLAASEQWCREQDIIAIANEAVRQKRDKINQKMQLKCKDQNSK
ncbi:hypothetical protein BVRB_023850, partial [Beta vulgaris subsp. vulgaris]